MRNTIYWTAVGLATGFVLVMILTGCTTTDGPLIGPCPPGQCVGPYDLTLSSHREALTNGI